MKPNKIVLNTALFVGMGICQLNAQESVNSGGGNASGEGGSVSYSIGQSFTKHTPVEDKTVSEGVQQPYVISIIAANEEMVENTLQISTFPNPTSDNLTISIADESWIGGKFELANTTGTNVLKGSISSEQTTMGTSNLLPGTYFLSVSQKNNTTQTFKILKK